MDNLELDAFIIRHQSTDIKELKAILADDNLEMWQIPYIESLIKEKEEKIISHKSYPKMLYRPAIGEGILPQYGVNYFTVNSPKEHLLATFKFWGSMSYAKPVSKFLNTPINLIKWFLKHWKVFLPVLVGAAVALFIHFDSKATSKAEKKEQHKITNAHTEAI